MPCYHPITAYRARTGRNPENGKWPVVFNPKEGYLDKEVVLPCGKCIGCRLERSRQWAVRCVQEASLWQKNCFITLTYNEENINRCEKGSLNKRDFVLFMKKVRKQYGEGIRFFHCGEYGEKLRRPHHHACLFNHDFSDKKLYTIRDNVKLYRSEQLRKLWPYGFSTIGEVTFESAAYVARYVTKKITGEKAADHYEGRLPEYITMSRRPGIGKPWWDKYKQDVLVLDRVVIRNNLQCRPPRYYDNLYDKENHTQLERIKQKRIKKINPKECTWERLQTKEKLKLKQFKQLKRGIENGINETLLNQGQQSINLQSSLL